MRVESLRVVRTYAVVVRVPVIEHALVLLTVPPAENVGPLTVSVPAVTIPLTPNVPDPEIDSVLTTVMLGHVNVIPACEILSDWARSVGPNTPDVETPETVRVIEAPPG